MKKSNIFSFVLGAIIFGTISVVSAYALLSSDVSYTPEDEGWNVDNVQDAIDDLNKNLKDRKVYCVALSGDKDTIGSKYACNLGDETINYFYLLKKEDGASKLIMQENIATGMTWNDAMNYLITGAGKDLKIQWPNIIDISLPSSTDIANAVNKTDWDLDTVTRTNDFCFGNIESNACIWQGSTAFATNAKQYSWLFDYTRECANFGCEHSLSSAYAFGYWTQDEDRIDNTYAWYVDRKGALTEDYPKTQSSYFGVRLVITVRDYILLK